MAEKKTRHQAKNARRLAYKSSGQDEKNKERRIVNSVYSLALAFAKKNCYANHKDSEARKKLKNKIRALVSKTRISHPEQSVWVKDNRDSICEPLR